MARFLTDGTYDGLVVDFDSSNLGNTVEDPTGIDFGSDGMMYIAHREGLKQYSQTGLWQQDIFDDRHLQ